MKYAVLLLAVACATAPTTTTTTTATTKPLVWRSFGAEAFAEAKRDHKLVFVDAGIEGCTACRWMHESTLADPAVIDRLNRDFVVVSVDADQQPDLGARFDEWAWPALVFYDADGHVIRGIRGNRTPQHFLEVLDAIAPSPASSSPRGAQPSSSSSPPPASSSSPPPLCAATFAELDRRSGGGGGPVHVEGAPVLVDLARDEGHASAARSRIAATTKLIDPVWGGVYVGAFGDAAALHPIPEKRAEHEAYALEVFAAAVARDNDAASRAAIGDVVKYLRGTLMADDGTFYSTQRDAPPNLPASMSAVDYAALGDVERRKFGVPAVDHGVYTDQNGRLIAALAHAADATGDDAVRALAVRAAEALLSTRMRTAPSFIAQAAPSDLVARDPRLRPIHDDERPYLRAQASFGYALVALFSSTGDARYIARAGDIAAGLGVLADPRGGFFDTTARDVDAVAGRSKSVADNIMAARFLFALADVNHDDAVRDTAHRALASVAARGIDDTSETVGLLALAVNDDEHGVVVVSVAGDEKDPAAQVLLTAARRAPAPSKLAALDVKERYPRGAKAAAYVCDKNACSAPIVDVAKLGDAVKRASPPLACP